MNVCDRESVQRLLAGHLSSEDEASFAEHLDSCSVCRNWLEQDAGSADDWQAARALLGQSSEVDHWHSTQAGEDTEAPEGGVPNADLERLARSILSPTDDLESLGRIGSHEVSGIVGRGGMGIVFKATDRSLNRNVAIKVLDPSLASIGAARQRFAREARAMAAISHEHVVPIYCVDEQQNVPYFAMEYVTGGTLEARLINEGPLNVVSAVRIAVQVAAALDAAHECGLVHRDIKPANILLDQGVERVRVADFGLARVSNDASFTRSGVLAGTPQYMSPEQVRGESCDARSDLFSLGSVLYAMCTGHPPFRAETVYGAMQRIVHDPPRSIREQNPDVPIWLEQFVNRLLAKERSQRFESAQEVGAILENELAHLQGAKSSPPPRDWIQQTSVGRSALRPSFVAMASVGVLVLVLGAALALLPDSGPDSPDESAQELAPSAVPLWDDGMREALQQAAGLENTNHGDDTHDPWDSEVQEIRRRLGQLESELP